MAWPTVTAEVMFNSPTWTDISAYLREVSVKRGVSRVDSASPLLRYDAGTATLTLDNRDRRFDPTNLAGPYVAGFASDSGVQFFKSNGSGGSVLPWGHGVTIDVKSLAGQTASVSDVRSSASGTTGSFTVTRPSGTSNGKLMLAFHSEDVGILSDLTLTGGTTWNPLTSISSGTDTIQTKVWWKFAGGSEPTNYTFGQNSGADGIAAVVCINNADTTATPVFASVANSNTDTHATPATSPAGPNDLEFRWAAASWGDYSPYTWSAPTGYTEYADRQSNVYTTGTLATKSLTGFSGLGTGTRVLPMRPVRVRATYPFTATTNLVKNPSFEVDTINWVASTAQTAISMQTGLGMFGGNCLAIQRLATSPPFQIYGAIHQSMTAGAVTGNTVTVSAYVYIPADSFSKVTGYSFTATGITSTFVIGPSTADAWYRLSLTTVLTANLDNLQVQLWTNDTHTEGQIVGYIDAVQAEVKTSATLYCDGAQPGCTWSGTAHNSSSIRPSSVTFDLFKGYIDQWQVEWTADVDSQVTVPCTDGFKVLSAINRAPVGAVGAGENAGARVTRVLDSASWPASDRQIATGNSTMQATTLEGDALSELYITSDSEIGELYINASGKVVFRNRQAIFTDTKSINVQAKFGDGGEKAGELQYHDVEISYDDQQIVNQARISRVGGTEQVASDATSIAEYLTHTMERSDLIVASDAEALSYAQWMVSLGKDPELRFDSLILRPQKDEDALFPQVLVREIGDRISAKRSPVGGGDTIYRELFIRGIEHTIQQYFWETKFSLQGASKAGSFLTLGHATLGKIGSNALVY